MSRRRLALSLGLLALAAALGAAAAAGITLLATGGTTTETTTVVEKPPPPPVSLDDLLMQSVDGRTLNDAAFYLMGADQYARALPFARKAVRYTSPGSVTRGYATFNLGLSLLKTGRCDEALIHLKRALKIEAKDQWPFIRPRIKQAQQCVQRGASAPGQSR